MNTSQKRHLWSLVLVALVVIACAPQAPPPDRVGGGSAPAGQGATEAGPKRVTFGVSTEIEGWSPYSQSGSVGNSIWQNIMEPLVRLEFKEDGTGTFVPVLAERWEAPDAKTWTFHLRRGVKFSDGTELTAADVEHSWNRIMNDDDSKQAGQLKAYVQSMEVVDPHTFRTVLKAPNATFLDEVRSRVIGSKAHFERLGKEQTDRRPLGTGPYLFKEWIQGQRFVVTRNASYWGPQPHVDEVVYRFIFEDEAKLVALANGEIDIAEGLPPHLISRVTGRAQPRTVDGMRHMFLAMRPDVPPTDNKLVRQAIYHAVDRATIARNVQEGYATELKGPLQSYVFGYDPGLPTYDYNPARARELLAQAGYAGGLSIDLYIPATQYTKAKETGQVIVAMLKDAGITANMRTPEWGTFSDDYNRGRYGFYLIGRGNVLDPSAYLVQYFQTGASRRLGYSNPRVDDLLTRQQASTDEAERKRMLSEAQRLIMEDAPAVFLYTYKDIYGVANHVDWQPLPNEYIWGFTAKLKNQ